VADQAWMGLQAVATLVALFVALKALRKDHTQELVQAVFADERWEKVVEKIMSEARDAGKVAAADRLQTMINNRTFMPREVQENTNKEIFRRLAKVEQKIDDVPSATADAVMIRLREERK
jgi:hypothetical protein